MVNFNGQKMHKKHCLRSIKAIKHSLDVKIFLVQILTIEIIHVLGFFNHFLNYYEHAESYAVP